MVIRTHSEFAGNKRKMEHAYSRRANDLLKNDCYFRESLDKQYGSADSGKIRFDFRMCLGKRFCGYRR